MPGGESAPKVLTEEAHSVQDELLRGYPETLSRAELERIKIDLGETAADGAGIIPPIDNVDVGFGEQPALPPGRGEQLAITAAPEQRALPPGQGEQLALESANDKRALPPGKSAEQTPITVGHIDLSHNAGRKAYDIANRKIEMMKKENEDRFLLHPKRIARNIWGYNYAHRKALIQAREDIKRHQDVNYGDDDFDEDMRKHYGEAIFDQFFTAPDDAIDNAAGEKREFFADDHKATQEVRALYAKFAEKGTDDQPAMTEDEFNAEIKRIRIEHMGEPLSETATGEVEQDNYLEAAKAIRGRIEQGEALDDVMDGFRLMRGESRADARTEVHKTKLDSILDRYEKSKFGESKYGSLVPSTVIVAGVSVGAFLATRGVNSAAKAAVFFGGSAAIGVVAGAREYRDITKQRAQMSREKFYGKDYSDDPTKRNEALSQFDYERLSVDTALENLDSYKEKIQSGEFNADDLKAALNEISNIQVLKELSASMSVDLFDHGESDDPNKHIKDRTALAVKQAELKVMLGELLKAKNPDALSALGAENDAAEDADVNVVISDQINRMVTAAQDEKIKAIDEKDALFRSYRRKEALKKGAKVAVFSFVAGTVIQEAWAAVSYQKIGLVEQVWGGNDNPGTNETMLAGFIPDHEAKVEHITVELPPERVDELRVDAEARGGYLEENHTTTYSHIKEQLTPAEYAKANPGELRHFENVRLFDNNTSNIDMNELGGQLSRGADGTVQPWDTMSRHGSIDGGDRIDMTNSSNNVFTIALQQPDGTHLQKVFEYGQSVDKPWSDLLYERGDGTWGFKGDGYIAWGQSAGDTLNVAASIAGDGGPNTLVIENTIPETNYDYVIHTPATDKPTDFGPAVWMPGGSRVGVAQRQKTTAVTVAIPALEQAPVSSDRLPEPIPKTLETTDAPEPEQKGVKQEVESEQRILARESGWPLLDLQLDANQNYTAEQWKEASEFIQYANSLTPNITEPLEQLHAAIALAEAQGKSRELKDLLNTVYKLNNVGDQEKTDAQGQVSEKFDQGRNAQDNGESERVDGAVELTPEQVERIEIVNRLIDDVKENIIAMRQDIPEVTFEKARVIYKDIARDVDSLLDSNGVINAKKLKRLAARAGVHQDNDVNADSGLFTALMVIGEAMINKTKNA